MATLSAQTLCKTYGSTSVLTGVDFEAADGEYIVLVGPSGCGKSTLLRCIAGLEEISSGELRIGARRVNDLAPPDRDVAMVFQSYALYPHLTVRENLGFALRIAKRPSTEVAAAVDEIARMLELGPLLDRLPAQLSGGQRQRVAMGRAIVRRPAVFLFDEPLSNLDAALRHHMRVELKRLHQRLKATIVHVTHDQVEAMTLADRILVLNKGIVQQFGTPRQLFDAPANTFVAQFIGSPSMALLPARGDGLKATIDGVSETLPSDIRGIHLIGVRPTDVRLGSGPLRAHIDVIESLGAESLIHLRLGEHRLIAQVLEQNLIPHPNTEVAIDFSRIHPFHPETGARLP